MESTIGAGSYNLDQLRAAGATNDEVSAINVYGYGCEATVFQHDHFGRRSVPFGHGIYNQVASTAKGAWHVHVSLIILRPQCTRSSAPICAALDGRLFCAMFRGRKLGAALEARAHWHGAGAHAQKLEVLRLSAPNSTAGFSAPCS